ncbi:type VI secretion system contractile sheath large subunit [Yokenella regensburgei]|uniref:type VI secretion system contractile sheath domain-containing protein n=1 Tax=Yokenella regensburgei TaxID=158877 RepID=UPI003F1603F0
MSILLIIKKSLFQLDTEIHDTSRQEMAAVIDALLYNTAASVDILVVNAMIAHINAGAGQQWDPIFYTHEFQERKAQLRSLILLVDRIKMREKIRIHLRHLMKEKVVDDRVFASGITRAGVYKHVCSSKYGESGGESVTAAIGNYALKKLLWILRC